MEGIVKNRFDNATDLEKQIVNTLNNIAKEYYDLSKEKQKEYDPTKQIKQRIGKIGKELEYNVLSTEHEREWLYDLVWYKKNSEGFKETVSLVLESEISRRDKDGLLCDFEKLLLSNADLRVMICCGEGNYNHPTSINSRIELFEKSFSFYKNIEQQARLLVLIWDDFMSGEFYPHLLIKNK